MDLKDFKILVVDDHFLLRQMVTTTLKTNGFTAIENVSSGALALSSVKLAMDNGAAYDVMFLDWSMPDMTGYDVLKELRADKRFDGLAVIMLSAESEDANIVSALEAGATAYITKPFKPETLMKKLDDIVVWRQKAKSGT